MNGRDLFSLATLLVVASVVSMAIYRGDQTKTVIQAATNGFAGLLKTATGQTTSMGG